MSAKKVFKYTQENLETEIRQVDKTKYLDGHDMAVQAVANLDTTLVSKMCGGTGSTIADVIIYDKDTKKETFRFPLRVLSMVEEQQVIEEALNEFNALPELSRIQALLIMKQIYYRVRKAMTLRPSDKEPVCTGAVFKMFTMKQLQTIHDRYEILADIVSPCLDNMEDSDIENVVQECIKKNYEALTPCSLSQLKKIVIFFSESIQPLRTDNVSSGEQSSPLM
jgi:hypothetical protein